jgi:hypothetical protein
MRLIRSLFPMVPITLALLWGCPTDEGDDDTGEQPDDDDDATPDDDDSAVGDDDDDSAADDDDTTPVAEWTQVATGDFHTCGVHGDGTVECWGLADAGVTADPAGTFAAVGSGWDHNCGLLDDGSVTCWGCYEMADVAACEAPAGTFAGIGSGRGHTCALDAAGSATCWGEDGEGQATAPEGEFVRVDGGYRTSCGLRTDGTVQCWGEEFGTIPDGTYVDLSVGREHACAVGTDGDVDCWGCTPPTFSSECDPPDHAFVAVAAGFGNFTCGIRDTGDLECWGDEPDGTDPPSGDFVQLDAGEEHACALGVEGDIQCWGADDWGQVSGGEVYSTDADPPPADSGFTCVDTEPNDNDSTEEPPYAQSTECADLISAGGLSDLITGDLGSIVQDSWDGDTDTYHFFTQGPGYISGSLDWPDPYADLDWLFLCYYADAKNPAGWYNVIPVEDTAYLNKPEQGTSLVPMPMNSECYAWVVGYTGADGLGYELRLWIDEP